MNCVLLHGWGMTRTIWNNFSLMFDNYSHVLVPCLYELANKSGNMSFESIASTLNSSIRNDTIIIAWSMSGLIAAPLAITNKNIKSIIFIGSTPCFVNKEDWENVIDESAINNLQDKLLKNPSGLLNYFSGLVAHGDDSEKETIRFVRSSIANVENSEILFEWLDQMKQIDQRKLFSKIEIPIQFILGKKDSLINSKIELQLKQLMPESEIKIINGCGHATFISKQKQTAEIINEFINAKL